MLKVLSITYVSASEAPWRLQVIDSVRPRCCVSAVHCSCQRAEAVLTLARPQFDKDKGGCIVGNAVRGGGRLEGSDRSIRGA